MLLLAERSVSHPRVEEKKPFIPDDLHTEKPSERLRFAMKTLEAAEAEDSLVKPDMAIWHGHRNGLCFACLGGLAAIVRFGINPIANSVPESLRSMGVSGYGAVARVIHMYEVSLNGFRQGCIGAAFQSMGLSFMDGFPFSRKIASYSKEPDQFKKDMENLILDLEESGW